MEIPKKQAVIYCRVSTKEQVEEGNSLVTQEKLCREYAQKNNFEVVSTYIEQGESAKNADRTELKKMLAFCTTKKNHIDAVIAYKIDRISRNTDDYSQIRMLLRRYGIEIKSTSEYFEDSPAGRFMENILANVAQFDNDVRTERSVNGMKEAVREGRYVWQAPYGYSNGKVQGKSSIYPNDKAKYVARAFELIAENSYPIETIRQKLINEGMLNSSGTPISKTTFYSLFRNPLYYGWIYQFKEWRKGTFQPIIPEQLFQKVQSILPQMKNPKIFKTRNEDFPLRRFIYHSTGRKLTGAWSKGKRMKYPYYFFHSLKLAFRKEILEQRFIDLLNEFQLENHQYEKLDYLINHYNARLLDTDKNAVKQVSSQIEKLKGKRLSILDKNADGIVSDALCKEYQDKIDGELFDLNKLLQEYTSKKKENKLTLLKIKKALLNPGLLWKDASFDLKIRLQWFYFPQGILIDKFDSRTPKTCRYYKVKNSILSLYFADVNISKKTSNTKHLPTIECSENTLAYNGNFQLEDIIHEIQSLSDIITRV